MFVMKPYFVWTECQPAVERQMSSIFVYGLEAGWFVVTYYYCNTCISISTSSSLNIRNLSHTFSASPHYYQHTIHSQNNIRNSLLKVEFYKKEEKAWNQNIVGILYMYIGLS